MDKGVKNETNVIFLQLYATLHININTDYVQKQERNCKIILSMQADLTFPP